MAEHGEMSAISIKEEPYRDGDTSPSDPCGSDEPLTESDPLLLRSRLLSSGDIEKLRKRRGKKRLAGFYEEQNEHIERLLTPMTRLTDDALKKEFDSRLKVAIAVRGSFAANIILAGLQVYAAVSSLSLSLFATMADSVFDPFSNLILLWAHAKAKTIDLRKYPCGGSRLETIGNITYSFLMGSVSILLIVESIQSLATGDDEDLQLHIPSLISVGIAFVTKLILFIYCYSIRDSSSQVDVLWEDHRNDLLINGFGIFTSAAGAKIKWYIDPIGAILISLTIIFLWTRTCIEQFQHLAGVSAEPEFLQLVIYKAMTFSNHIKQIDSCRAYHSGPNLFVEVDVVMDADTPLRQAHDLSQELQDRLEDLPGVDRAFVHVDYETEHRPEHRKHTVHVEAISVEPTA